MPDLERAVADWLAIRLAELKDVGRDPREGTVEIEAKVGNIIHNETKDRISLPVMSACVLAPEVADKHYSFESRMIEVSLQP